MKLFKRILLTAAVLGFSITLPAGAMFDGSNNNNNNPFTPARQLRSNLDLTGMQGTESDVNQEIQRLSREAILAELNKVNALIQDVVNVLHQNNGNAPMMIDDAHQNKDNGNDHMMIDDANGALINAPVYDVMEAPEIVPLYEPKDNNNNNLQRVPVASETTLVNFFNRVTKNERATQLINDFNSPTFEAFLKQHKFSGTWQQRLALLPLYIIALQEQFNSLPRTTTSTIVEIDDSKSSSTSLSSGITNGAALTTTTLLALPAAPVTSPSDDSSVAIAQISGQGTLDELAETQRQADVLEAENAELERLDETLQTTAPSLLERTTKFFSTGFDNVRKFIKAKRKISSNSETTTYSQSTSPSFLEKAKEKVMQCFGSGVAKTKKVRERIKRKRSDEDGDLVNVDKKVKHAELLSVIQPVGHAVAAATCTCFYKVSSYVHPLAPYAVAAIEAYNIYKVADNIVKVVRKNNN